MELIKFYDSEHTACEEEKALRYVIILGSESGHSCFEFTIWDVEGGAFEGSVCETFTKEDAIKICSALNNEELRQGSKR